MGGLASPFALEPALPAGQVANKSIVSKPAMPKRYWQAGFVATKCIHNQELPSGLTVACDRDTFRCSGWAILSDVCGSQSRL